MGRKGIAATASLVVALAACSELPVETQLHDHGSAPVAAFSSTQITCDKAWMLPVDGNWTDSTKWAPAGEPGLLDDVCFQGAGSYTITMPGGNQSIADVHIDDGAVVTLTGGGLTAGNLTIARTGRLEIWWSAPLWVAAATIDGSLEVSGTAHTGDIQLNGLLSLQQGIVNLSGDLDFGPTGELMATTVSNYINVDPGRVLRMSAGRVTGGGAVWIQGGSFEWSGGALPAYDDVFAVVNVKDGELVLENTTLAGTIGVDNGTVTGHIGSAVDVRVANDVAMRPPRGEPSTSPVQVMGILAATKSAQIHASAIENHGTIRVPYRSNSGGNLLEFRDLARLDNRGSIEVEDGMHVYDSHVESRGSIDITSTGQMTLFDSDLMVDPAGTMTGSMALGYASRLWGVGNVGSVSVQNGGIVSPGTPAAPLATLTVEKLELHTGGRVVIDLLGTAQGQYDRIRSTSSIQYGGTLDVRYLGSFLGGVCGQIIPVLSDATTTAGAFDSLLGVQPAADRAWRTHYGSSGFSLVGYDPTAARAGFAHSRINLSEGGNAKSVSVCLGHTAPTADVSLTQTGGAAQASISPTTVDFSLADWMLPRSIAVSAVDDPLAEGPHNSILAFQTASADPGYDLRATNDLRANIADNDPAPDLTTSLVWTAPATINANQQFEARFRVTNNGPGPSNGSTLSIVPMSGIDYVSSTVGVTCTPSAGQVTCSLGAIAAGAQVEFVVVFRALTAGTLSNTVRITGEDFDANPTNDAFTWNVTVN